jgi:hypothetical protein
MDWTIDEGMMKSRFLWALIAGASCVVLTGPMAGAQTSDSTRGYEVQALRFESYWGNAKIIRGADGPVVGTAGWFRSFDVAKLVVASPPALAEAHVYKTNSLRGSVVGTLGATATAVGIVVAANGSSNAASPMLIIGGVGAMVWGAKRLNTAVAALSRSLWWYNRDLARASQTPPAVGKTESPKEKPRS